MALPYGFGVFSAAGVASNLPAYHTAAVTSCSSSHKCLHLLWSFSGAWGPAGAEIIALRAGSVDRSRGGSSALLPAATGGGL